MLVIYSILAALTSFILCEAASSPPSNAITVGNGGKYPTLAAALQDTSSSVFFIYSGTYNGQTYISRSNIKIYGQTNTPNSYTANTVTFTNSLPASSAGSNDASGTIRVNANNVALYNLNIANTYGNSASHSQAIALSLQGSQFGGYGLKITGYQDTLLANKGYNFISNSMIEGAVDFIFGLQASLWITNSVINVVGTGWITASGRETDDTYYYVIDNSKIQGSGSTYFGRPWRNYARVVFQNSNIGSNVNSAGWADWGSSSPNTDHVEFSEYNNSGPGAAGSRASFSYKRSSPVSINTVLSSTSWVDSSFLSGSGVTTPLTSTSTTAATTTQPTSLSTTTTTTTAPQTTTSDGSGGCTVQMYGQCGGQGYVGCSMCTPGSTCKTQNDWYSQCL